MAGIDKAKRGKNPVGKKSDLEANKAFLKKADRIKTIFVEVEAGFPLKIHALGVEVNELKDEPKYGTGAVERLMELLARGRDSLTNAQRLADAYEVEEIKGLCALVTKTGRPLSCRHFLHVAGHKNRIALLKKAAAEGWTAAELEREVQKAKPAEQKSNAGRPLKTPVSFDGMLRHQENENSRWLQRYDGVWSIQGHTLSHFVRKVPDGAAKPEELTALGHLEEQYSRLLTATEHRLADCRAAIRLLKAKVPNAEQVSAADAEPVADEAGAGEEVTQRNDDDEPEHDPGTEAAQPER